MGKLARLSYNLALARCAEQIQRQIWQHVGEQAYTQVQVQVRNVTLVVMRQCRHKLTEVQAHRLGGISQGGG